MQKNSLLIRSAIKNPFVKTVEGLEQLKAEFAAGEYTGFLKKLDNQVQDVNKAMRGDIFGLPDGIQKNFELLSGTRSGTMVGDYRSWQNELEIDTAWQPIYRFTATGGAVSSVDIIDFAGAIVVHELNDGDPIKATQYGADSKTKINETRRGTKIPFLNRWLQTNDLYSINDAIEGIKLAFLEKKANEAYIQIAANTGNNTTATAATPEAIIAAMNTGIAALYTRLADKGFNVSTTMPVGVLVREAHRSLLLRALRTVVGENGNNDTLIYPVNIGSTFNTNFPLQFSGKDAMMAYVPGLKNVWNSFRANSMEISSDFSTDSQMVMAQEYWGSSTNADQFQTIGMEL